MKYAVIGGAGFIGSYVTEILLEDGNTVMVFDNFSSGTKWHLKGIFEHL